MTTAQIVQQIGVLLFSLPAAFLAGSEVHRTRRWAYLFGMLAQPFWFWISVSSGLWGVFALSCFYAFCWARGFYNHWVRAAKEGGPWGTATKT
jgi:hypothetical protein